MVNKSYMSRLYDDLLAWRLETKGAVLVEGPKWCGKTRTCEQQAASVVYMQDPQSRETNRILAETSPETLLGGPTPRLIDEWQIEPCIWDAVRHVVDKRERMGQFLLTGSATPPNYSQIEHSGVGRITSIQMHTMSLLESKESSGEVSLKSLFTGEPFMAAAASVSSLEEMAWIICRGGWPQAVKMNGRAALQQAIDYIDILCENDITRFDGVTRDSQLTHLILKTYARNSGMKTPYTTLFADVSQAYPVSFETLRIYLSILENLFVIEDLKSWSPNLRSKTAIRSTPARFLTDPSLAAAALGATPNLLMQDLETLGLLFENLCIRDLRIYAQALDGNVWFYRDKHGLECDAILQLRSGRYGLIEVKIGGETAIESAAKTLNALHKKLNTDKMGEPAFKMVLTAVGEYAYQRKDNILVVPVRTLGV